MNASFVTMPACSRISPISSARRPSGMTTLREAVRPSAMRFTASIDGDAAVELVVARLERVLHAREPDQHLEVLAAAR